MQKIYCGPNVIKYNLMKYQVFTSADETYPYNVREAIQDIPEVERLFCEVDDLERMRSAVQETGSAENVYYSAVEKRVAEMMRSKQS